MKPEKIIPKRISRAMMEYKMVKKGDTILMALSGGKDSMTMAWFLSRMASAFPETYRIEAVHVTAPWEGDVLPLWIRNTCEEWNIPLTLLPLNNRGDRKPNCHDCSRLRRKVLLTYGAEKGFNRIALGHHMEDCLTTYLMNLIYQGRQDPLYPLREYPLREYPLREYPLREHSQGDKNPLKTISLIRPLILLQEEVIRVWAQSRKAIGPSSLCPWESSSSRRREMREKLELLTESSVEKKLNMFKAVINT